MKHTPYTYRIKFKLTNEYYYGVRYAKKCHPTDLWVTYFTSSKKIKQLIQEYGVSAFDYEVRQIFETKESAIAWEARITDKVVHWPNYLNSNSGPAFNHSKCVGGGQVAKQRGSGICGMTMKEKQAAGRKGGEVRAAKYKERGPTEKEKQKYIDCGIATSMRRRSGGSTQKEIDGMKQLNERRTNGEWTEKELAAHTKLHTRRQSGEWTEKELAGFEKVSAKRSTGIWHTDGKTNKFILPDYTIPPGWYKGFSRKKNNITKVAGWEWWTDGAKNIRVHDVNHAPLGFHKGFTQRKLPIPLLPAIASSVEDV